MGMTEINVGKFEDRNDFIWRRERNNQKEVNRALRGGKIEKVTFVLLESQRS